MTNLLWATIGQYVYANYVGNTGDICYPSKRVRCQVAGKCTTRKLQIGVHRQNGPAPS